MQHRNRGDSHAIIIVVIILGILCALGYVFYTRFMAKAPSTATMSADQQALAQPKASTITEVTGTDMLRYTNNELGFRFDFPRRTYGSTTCELQKQWYDNYGNLYDAPVTAYTSAYGMVDMTVLESANMYTITQKQAPLFTSATYGSDQRQYYSNCTMSEVTQALIAGDKDLSTAYRSWQVYKIGSQGEIAEKANQLDSLAYNENVTSVQYSLGTLENGRQAVTYSFTYNPSDGFVGGGASRTWYYPKQKLLVHIGLGQDASFPRDSTSEAFYIDEIVNSFTVL